MRVYCEVADGRQCDESMKRLKLNALFEDKAIGEDSDINTF